MAAAQTMAMTTTQKIIAIAVTIIIISTVAIPVIDDFSDSAKAVKQNTAQQYFATSNLTESLEIAATGSGTTIGTYTTSIADLVVLTDTFGIRNPAGSALYLDSSSVVGLSIEITDVTLSPGVLTYTSGDDEYTLPYSSYVIYAAASGDYGLFTSGDELKFNKDTVLYTYFAQKIYEPGTATDHYCVGSLSGTYETLKSKSAAYINSGSSVVTTLTMTLSDVSESDGYYSYTVGSRPVVAANGYTGSANYEAIFAPIQYLEDTSTSGLIAVIPILLILVPLMMAVRMIALKRN